MKTKPKLSAICQLLSAICLSAHAQGTAFTYQGRLNEGADFAGGSYNLTFTIFGVASGGSAVAGPLTNSPTGVTNGLFTVTLDFGANIFTNANRFLEIAVRTNSVGSFTTLSPRQKLTPTPYAIFAENVGIGGLTAGPYGNAVTFNNAANNFSGGFTGNGAGVSNVNALTLGGLSSSNFWHLGGNAGANPANGNFIGTTDNLSLELRVNGGRALRLEPNTNGAPNVIGGSPFNVVDSGAVGAVIAGGGATNFSGSPHTNHISSSFGFIGAGFDNTIQTNSESSLIVGGQNNLIRSSFSSTIGGGFDNTIGTNADVSTIGGGFNNDIQAGDSFIGGGTANSIQSNSAAISTIGGGFGNVILSQSRGFIGGGILNQLGGTGPGGSVGSPVSADEGNAIAGGTLNLIFQGSSASFIGGGVSNIIAVNSFGSTIAGGFDNDVAANADLSVIGGGANNAVSGQFATVPGGRLNQANGDYAFTAGRRAKANHMGTFIWADSTDADFTSSSSNQFLIRASGGVGIGTASPHADLHVVGSTVFQGLTTPSAAAATNILNIGSGAIADGFRNGISFFEAGNGTAMSLGYDGTGGSSQNALRIYHTTGKDLFTFEADGRLGVGTNAPQQALHVIGNILASGTVTGSSDRNAKENFTPVNPVEVLNKVTALPISRWNYKTETDVMHLGPMAQDFYSAFAVGMDDQHISMVDADGVALAAIQGLNTKVEDTSQRSEIKIQKLEAENAELKRRLEALETIIRNQKPN
jgi:hypothetical protein